MCDFSGKLVAWMDREIPDGRIRGAERHFATVRNAGGASMPISK